MTIPPIDMEAEAVEPKTDWNVPIQLTEREKGYKEALRDAVEQIIKMGSAESYVVQPETWQQCQSCGGDGWVSGSEPECCGNVTDHGECRGSCAVEKQIQLQCILCSGAGKFPLPKPPSQKDGK